MQATESDFIGQVSRKYEDLSPKLKLAARYVMDHQVDVASYSLRQIAEKSGLSPPTFSRLARAVGFEEYEALRQRCRTDIQKRQVSLAERASLIHDYGDSLSDATRGSFAAKHARVAVNNIQQVIEAVDPDKLADAADRLSTAREVVLIGGQSSRTVLDYLRHIASLATSNWKLFGQAEKSAGSELADVDSGTVALTVSIAPYLRRTVTITEQFAARGAEVVAITDDIGSPLLKYAKHSFIVPTESRQFFPSHVAILTFLEILAGMVIRRLGEDANQRIDRVEKLSHAIGDYI